MEAYGMTEFTQRALMELEKIQNSRRRRPVKRLAAMEKMPPVVKQLLEKEEKQRSQTPPLKNAARRARLLTKHLSQTPPPTSGHQKAESDSGSGIVVAIASETVHHKHHLRQKQLRIEQLEEERLRAVQEAKVEQTRHEKLKERRLGRVYQAKINSLHHVERDLQTERRRLEDEHRTLRERPLPVSETQLPKEPETVYNMCPGAKVRLVPENELEAHYEYYGMPALPEESISLLKHGCVVERLSNERPGFVRVRSSGVIATRFDIPQSCLIPQNRAESVSSPQVVTAAGEHLICSGVNVTAEILGDTAYVTHRTDWVFAEKKDSSCTNASVSSTTPTTEGLPSNMEYLGLFVPQDPTMTLVSFAIDIGEMKLRSATLRQTVAEELERVSSLRREARSKRQPTPASGGGGGEPSPKTPSQAQRRQQEPPIGSQSDGEDDATAPTGGVFDGIWIDAFDVMKGGGSYEQCLVVPLKESRRTEQIHCELRYLMTARLAPLRDVALLNFNIPSQLTEFSLGNTKMEDISSLQVAVCGFGQKGVRLETYPPTKLQKCTALAGTKPNYTVATKAGRWQNRDASIMFSPERSEEINIQCFAETNPSMINSDTFLLTMTPLAPLNFELTYRRVVAVVIDGDGDMSAVAHGLRLFVGSLVSQDFLTLILHRGGNIAMMTSPKMSDSPIPLELRELPDIQEVINSFLAKGMALLAPSTEEAALQNIPSSSGSSWRSTPSSNGVSPLTPSFPLGDASASYLPDDALPMREICGVADVGAAVILGFDSLSQFQNRRDKRMLECVRELVVFSHNEIPPNSCAAVGTSRFGSGIGVRFHSCSTATQRSPTASFLKGISYKSRGRAAHAWYPETRGRDIASFVAYLGRPLAIDLEVAFVHTSQLELPCGLPDLCAGVPLVVPGRYSCAGTEGNASDHLSVTGRFPKGRLLRRRLLNSRLTIPITKLLEDKFITSQLASKALETMMAFARRQGTTSTGSRGSNASGSGGALTATASTNPAGHIEKGSSYPEIFNEASQYSLPLCDPFLGSQHALPTTDDAGESGDCELVVYQLQPSAMDPNNAATFPPVVSSTSPGLVPPGGSRSWGEYAFRRIEKIMIECGCFSRVVALPGTGSLTSAPPNKSIAMSQWLSTANDTYESEVLNILNSEAKLRAEIESDEWHEYLNHLEAFHEHRIQLLLRAVQQTGAMSGIEEDHRKAFLHLVEDERSEWKNFLDDTASLRAVMDRVNLFAHEGRRRMAYAEEDARNAIIEHQKVLWTLTHFVATSILSTVTLHDVEHLMEAIDRFIHDPETMTFISSMLSVWSLPPNKAEVIGLNGGIQKVKSLLQMYGSNDRIVESLLICISNFAGVRTNHGKLETSNIVLEVMHALAQHTVSINVQYRGVRCLATLASLTQDFRHSVIVSPNGLEFVLTNFNRYLKDFQYTLSTFQFFLTTAKEITSHRRIVEQGLRTMLTATMVIHQRRHTLKTLFFRLVSALASSRALRAQLATLGGPTCLINTVLSQPSRHPLSTVNAAIDCAEKLCGNVGDYPAVALSFGLSDVLSNLLKIGPDIGLKNPAIEQAHRLLCRLSLCRPTEEVNCDVTIRSLFKEWNSLSLFKILNNGEEEMSTSSREEQEGGILSTLYGVVVRGEIECGGTTKKVMVRIFSRRELVDHLLPVPVPAADGAPPDDEQKKEIKEPRREEEATAGENTGDGHGDDPRQDATGVVDDDGVIAQSGDDEQSDDSDDSKSGSASTTAGLDDDDVDAETEREKGQIRAMEEREEKLYEACLNLQIQDVLTNAFVSHPAQIQCLGFSTKEDFHCTIFEMPTVRRASPPSLPGGAKIPLTASDEPRLLGPSLREFLHYIKTHRYSIPYSYFFEVAFTLLDVASFYKDARTPHRDLSLDTVYVADHWDAGMDVVCAPAAPITTDIVETIPVDGQTLFDVDAMAEVAKKNDISDVMDVKALLFEMLYFGEAPENETTIEDLELPLSLTSVLFATEEDAESDDISAPPFLDAGELRDFLAHWRWSEEGSVWNARPINTKPPTDEQSNEEEEDAPDEKGEEEEEREERMEDNEEI